jgi:nucleoporin NDC1
LLNASTALSHLVCASLAEDQYGVVQRDIPQILEALSSFLSAVEQYQSEIGARHAPTAPTEPPSEEALEEECMRLELEKAQEILADVREGMLSRFLLF